MGETTKNERPLRRWFARTVLALGVVAMLIAAWLVAYPFYQRHRLDRALEAIRARGEPVTPDEIAFGPRKTPSNFLDNLARCKAVSKSRVDWDEGFDETDPGPFLDGVRGAELSNSLRDVLTELRACLDDARRNGEDVERYNWLDLGDSPAVEPSRCFVVAHRARRVAREPSIAAIQELCRGDPLDAKASLDAWRSSEDPEGLYPADGLGLAIESRTLLNIAIDLSIESRTEEALSHVRTIFEGSTKIEDVPWLTGYQAWHATHACALTGLRSILEKSPRDLDLTGLDRHLDAGSPRTMLVRAMLGERAIVCRFFENLRRLWNEGDRRPDRLPAFLFATYSVRDHAEYMERMAEAIELAREPYWESARSDWVNRQEAELDNWEMVTRMLLPRVEEHLQACAADQAGILLARCALVVRREGAEAGRREAVGSIDPFSGQPLRAKFDPSGALRMWSVGPNLVDDGGQGQEPSDDIVWRIPPR